MEKSAQEQGLLPKCVRIAKENQITPDEKLHLYAQAKSLFDQGRTGQVGHLAKKFSVNRNYPRRLVDQMDAGKSVLRKQGAGRPTAIDEEKQKLLQEFTSLFEINSGSSSS